MLSQDKIEILRKETGAKEVGATFTLEGIVARNPEVGELRKFGTEVSKCIKDVNDNRLDFLVYNELLPNGRPSKSEDGKIIYRRLR